MNDKTLTALQSSIAHWARLATGTANHKEGVSTDDCALCHQFYGNWCSGCPVKLATGVTGCAHAHYKSARRAYDDDGAHSLSFLRAASFMHNFLCSLLPMKTISTTTSILTGTPAVLDFTEWKPSVPWTLPRYIPGFRPLAPSEQWHREDFTKDMLPDGWRPLLLNEKVGDGDQYNEYGCRKFVDDKWFGAKVGKYYWHARTRRPLPHTDEWIPWEGGECPVDGEQLVRIEIRNGSRLEPEPATIWTWGKIPNAKHREIIAFQLVRDAKPEPEPKTPTLRDKIERASNVMELRDLLLQALPDLGIPPAPAPAILTTAHNPAKLTPEQVGVAEGWRLLDEDEIQAGVETHFIQRWLFDSWDDTKWQGCNEESTYRTRLSREELAKLRAGK